MIKKWDLKKKVKELLKYTGAVCCLVAAETVFRVQPEIRTALVSATDEVPVLYDLLWGMIVIAILQMIPYKKIRCTVYGVLSTFLCLFLFSEYIYCRIFGRIYGIHTLQYAGEANDFAGMVWSYLDDTAWGLLAVLVILGIAGGFLTAKLQIEPGSWKKRLLCGGCALLFCTAGIIGIPKLFKETAYTDQGPITYTYKKTIYTEWIDNKRAVCMFGAYEFLARDIHLAFLGDKVSEEDLETVEAYFSEEHRSTNDMTGALGGGRNLILILMESIDDWLINEETTPTMCRLMEEGINFTNMYTPIFGGAATLNSEFCSYTGLTAPANGVPVVNYTNNAYPYALPFLFREKGYRARSFHYNWSSYYNRLNMHTSAGFEEYVSYLEYEEDEIAQQDATLVRNDEIYQKFVEDTPFFNLVITFSGHASLSGKAYSHEDDAIKLYPEYIGMYDSPEMDSISAKARLTDDMFAELLARLEADGLLEDTVIIAYGDHYDYTIHDQDYLKELSDAQNVYELSKTPFFIWAKDLEHQEMTKVVNTTDIYPTICNLFGLDNRGYFTGNDMFDDNYEGYAYWQDGSWITSEGAFYNETGEQIGDVDAEKAAELQSLISKKLNVNQLILDTDFFRQEK